MKITKNEKRLWNFLNLFKTIFSKTSNRTIIYGRKNNLYLHTLGYAGVFTSIKNEEQLLAEYDFKHCFYELKQLPCGSYVLDQLEEDPISGFELKKIDDYIHITANDSTFVLETTKSEEFKIAKIAETTGLWIADADIKYLNVFPFVNISTCSDALVFECETKDYIQIFIINNLEGHGVIQQKMDLKENQEMSAQEIKQIKAEEEELNSLLDEVDDIDPDDEDGNEEVLDDEFDPMLA